MITSSYLRVPGGRTVDRSERSASYFIFVSMFLVSECIWQCLYVGIVSTIRVYGSIAFMEREVYLCRADIVNGKGVWSGITVNCTYFHFGVCLVVMSKMQKGH